MDRATAEDALELIRVARSRWWIHGQRATLPTELGTNVVWHDTLSELAISRRGSCAEHFVIQHMPDAARTFRVWPPTTRRTASSSGRATSAPGADHLNPRHDRSAPLQSPQIELPRHRRRPSAGRRAGLSAHARSSRGAGQPARAKWIERTASRTSPPPHARVQRRDGRGELAYRADGFRALAPAVRTSAGQGRPSHPDPAQPHIRLGNIASWLLPHPRHPLRAWSGLTNKCPSGANRGIGKPASCASPSSDRCRPAPRSRNCGCVAEMPHHPQAQYDSGDYPATLPHPTNRLARNNHARARRVASSIASPPPSSLRAPISPRTARHEAAGRLDPARRAMRHMEPDGNNASSHR